MPRQTELVVNDSLDIELAAWDAQGQPRSTEGVVWSTSNPAVASVNASGRVVIHNRGFARIVATLDNAADTAAINIVPPWLPMGFARIEGSLLDEDGSPAALVPLDVLCGGARATAVSDGNGHFSLLLEKELESYPYLSDAREAPCVVRTGPGGGVPQDVTFVTASFSRPGWQAPVSNVLHRRAARTAMLTLNSASPVLETGQEASIQAIADGRPVTDVSYQSLLPAVATVDAQGRVLARAPGTTLIVAQSRTDSTRVGWIDVRVMR